MLTTFKYFYGQNQNIKPHIILWYLITVIATDRFGWIIYIIGSEINIKKTCVSENIDSILVVDSKRVIIQFWDSKTAWKLQNIENKSLPHDILV